MVDTWESVRAVVSSRITKCAWWPITWVCSIEISDVLDAILLFAIVISELIVSKVPCNKFILFIERAFGLITILLLTVKLSTIVSVPIALIFWVLVAQS